MASPQIRQANADVLIQNVGFWCASEFLPDPSASFQIMDFCIDLHQHICKSLIGRIRIWKKKQGRQFIDNQQKQQEV